MVSSRLAFLAVAAAGIFNGVLAQPHLRHMNKQHARDVTVVQYQTAPVVNVIVYVDQFGNTISRMEKTEVPGNYAPTPAPVQPTTAPVYVAPKPTTKAKPKPKKKKTTTKAAAPAPSQPAASGNGKLGKGVVYSPYHNDGTCKDKTTVLAEMKQVFSSSQGFNWVRIYGTDCAQVVNVVCAAYEVGVKVMLGIYDIENSDNFHQQLNELIAGVKAANKEFGKSETDWSSIALISVGNEVVNKYNGDSAWVSKSLEFAGIARSSLRAVGYTGTVANADVWFRVIDAPALCGEDKIVPVNMHPFFDQSCDVAGSGTFLKTMVGKLQAACPDKEIMVVETGWPNAGNKMNNAQPGQSEQTQFIALAAANLDNYILLGAYDEGWKQENTAAHVEKHWGILGSSPSN